MHVVDGAGLDDDTPFGFQKRSPGPGGPRSPTAPPGMLASPACDYVCASIFGRSSPRPKRIMVAVVLADDPGGNPAGRLM
ncbi:hypothetical protein OG726_52290 [Streptomyces sp. NBC_01373]|nr:hypothetical protein [Streptomyces sp. NBC_01373]